MIRKIYKSTQDNSVGVMLLLRHVFILLVLISAFNTVKAQERTLTVEEAVKLGLENSKTLKYSQSKIDQAVSQYNQAKDRALPTGSVSYMYSRAQIPANHFFPKKCQCQFRDCFPCRANLDRRKV